MNLTTGLQRLEHGLRATAAPVVDHWAPGIAPEDAADLVGREIGLSLPDEVLTWFAWHNGIVGADRPDNRRIAARYLLLSLAECVDYTRMWREIAATLFPGEVDPELIWRSSWFAITHDISGNTLAVDCSGPAGVPAPVISLIRDDPVRRQVAASLAEVVDYWAGLLESGCWYYEPGTGWQMAFDDADPGVRRELT